jgi:hypothetical protein
MMTSGWFGLGKLFISHQGIIKGTENSLWEKTNQEKTKWGTLVLLK